MQMAASHKRILAVDYGAKRIGLALSDPSGSIARPLTVIEHASRNADAARVIEIAEENEASLILVGQSFDEEGRLNPAGRRSVRFVEMLRSLTDIPSHLWDESLSTQEASHLLVEMDVPRAKRKTHLDEMAAAIILQSYLNSRERD